MPLTILFGLILALSSSVSSRVLDPIADLQGEMNEDLDLLELEKMLLSDEHRDNEFQAKREFISKTFMDDIINDLNSQKRGLICKEDSSPKCAKYKKWCNLVPMVRERCQTTCRICKAPAPEKCIGDLGFGCCWNGSPAKDSTFSNCPVCEDKYAFCKSFADSCEKSSRTFMKQNCPESCDRCDKATTHA